MSVKCSYVLYICHTVEAGSLEVALAGTGGADPWVLALDGSTDCFKQKNRNELLFEQLSKHPMTNLVALKRIELKR